MKKILLFVGVLLLCTVCLDAKKFSLGRGFSSNRRTSYKPAPTSSASHAQASAPKQTSSSLFGWQEKSSGARQSKPSQSHSYPSSATGLSGNSKSSATHQDHAQKSYPQNNAGAGQQTWKNTQQQPNQQNHGYPASQGLSGTGNSGTGSGYPQQHGSGLSGTGNSGSGSGYPQQHGSGLSGTGSGYPQQHGSGLSGAAPPAYPGNSGHTGLSGGAPPPYPGSNQGHFGAAPPPYSNKGYSGVNGQPGYSGGYHHPPPPPPYPGGYGGYNSGYGSQMPGYFGNYGNNGNRFGGMSRSGSALTGVGIAGAGIGTVLTGLALWNLARSTGRQHHTVIYDNRGQPVAVAPSNDTAQVVDPNLADLVNCTLTIDSGNSTEVLAIPCAIATSFSPDAHVEDSNIPKNATDNTKCIITVVTKSAREFTTTIPCSILLNTAAENNVTEAVIPVDGGESAVQENGQSATLLIPDPGSVQVSDAVNCTTELDSPNKDLVNPCQPVNTNLTVIPLNVTSTTPVVA